MRLEQRADELDVVRFADDDRVWITDVDDGDLETGDPLTGDDRRGAELGLVEPVARAAHVDDTRPHPHTGGVVTRALHQPGAGDARPVAGHLRVRSIRIHDPDVHGVPIDRQHIDRSVEAVLMHVRLTLEDEVHVPVCVPARRCHRRSRPAGDPRRP